MGPLTGVLKLIGLLARDTKLFPPPPYVKREGDVKESRVGNVVPSVEAGLSNNFEVGGHFTILY